MSFVAFCLKSLQNMFSHVFPILLMHSSRPPQISLLLHILLFFCHLHIIVTHLILWIFLWFPHIYYFVAICFSGEWPKRVKKIDSPPGSNWSEWAFMCACYNTPCDMLGQHLNIYLFRSATLGRKNIISGQLDEEILFSLWKFMLCSNFSK